MAEGANGMHEGRRVKQSAVEGTGGVDQSLLLRRAWRGRMGGMFGNSKIVQIESSLEKAQTLQ